MLKSINHVFLTVCGLINKQCEEIHLLLSITYAMIFCVTQICFRLVQRYCISPYRNGRSYYLDLIFSSSSRIWKNHPLNYASAKKVRKSASDESNSVAAQQREDRRRRYVNEPALLNESTGSSETSRRYFVCSFFGRIAKIAGLCKYGVYPSGARQHSSIFHGRYNAKMFSKRRENRTR